MNTYVLCIFLNDAQSSSFASFFPTSPSRIIFFDTLMLMHVYETEMSFCYCAVVKWGRLWKKKKNYFDSINVCVCVKMFTSLTLVESASLCMGYSTYKNTKMADKKYFLSTLSLAFSNFARLSDFVSHFSYFFIPDVYA